MKAVRVHYCYCATLRLRLPKVHILDMMQWTCWLWPTDRDQRRKVLRLMARSRQLSPAHRRLARRKLREMQ
jgi:hypothetical protein